MTDDPFLVEITIAAPIDQVWNALRDRDQIRRWHGWQFDGLDKEIDEIYSEQVTESAAEHWLEVNGGDRFELTDLGGDGTRLRLIRAPRSGDAEWDAYYDDISEGWITFVHQLRFALERHPGVDRRTVFLSGAGATPVPEAAGLASASALTPAQPYTLDSAGEPLSGQVWFRSANQLGLTVDGWGDGLLIATNFPPSQVHPQGAASMVLTVYGLGDAEFAALESTWNAWWNGVYTAEPDAG